MPPPPAVYVRPLDVAVCKNVAVPPSAKEAMNRADPGSFFGSTPMPTRRKQRLLQSQSPSSLLLVPVAGEGELAPLQLLLEVLVDGKGDGLAGGDTHDAGGDALVEGVEAFLPVARLARDPTLESVGRLLT